MQPIIAYLETEDQAATNKLILKPNEQEIKKNILYSMSSTSSP